MEGVSTTGNVNRTAVTVLLVSNHGDIVGGGEISLLTLLKGFNRSRVNPVVVVPAEGELAKRCRGLGIPTHVIPLPSLRRPGFKIVRALWLMAGIIARTGARLLHANGSRAMFYAGIAGWLKRRPVVWHLRLLDRDPGLDWVLARLAARTITISEAVRGRLAPWPRAHDKAIVIHNGIDVAGFVPIRSPESIRGELGIGIGAPVIGTVGRLVAFKGMPYLLQAFRLVRQARPEARLVLVGEGPERQSLEKTARELDIAEAVCFAGHREDVADLLSIMNLFVLPSLAEHFGRVLLEAMCLRLPVVATAAGGVPEVVKQNETGLLVPPADPPALAKSILLLLEDPARAQAMGLAGRQRVEEFFDHRAHARLIERLYFETLGFEAQDAASGQGAAHQPSAMPRPR